MSEKESLADATASNGDASPSTSQPNSPSSSAPAASPSTTATASTKGKSASPSTPASAAKSATLSTSTSKATASANTVATGKTGGKSDDSGVNWTSVLTFGLASSKGKADISDWLPELGDRVPAALFAVPANNLRVVSTPGQTTNDSHYAMDSELASEKFPNFISLLPPPPVPASQLRFGWVDEYGDYHPVILSAQSDPKKLNPKLLKAKDQAKEIINNVIQMQETLERNIEPTSPRMSGVVKHRLSLEAGSAVIGVDNLVQVVEGKKGDKQVVVKQEESTEQEM